MKKDTAPNFFSTATVGHWYAQKKRRNTRLLTQSELQSRPVGLQFP